jgi:hypothetical protein
VIEHLQRYQLAKEQATRSNRNLLQFGAAIATFLAIGAGSGSVLALADSVAARENESLSLPSWAIAALVAEVIAIVLVVLFLSLLLFEAFSLRREAERQADEHLKALISEDPDRYWPQSE